MGEMRDSLPRSTFPLWDSRQSSLEKQELGHGPNFKGLIDDGGSFKNQAHLSTKARAIPWELQPFLTRASQSRFSEQKTLKPVDDQQEVLFNLLINLHIIEVVVINLVISIISIKLLLFIQQLYAFREDMGRLKTQSSLRALIKEKLG